MHEILTIAFVAPSLSRAPWKLAWHPFLAKWEGELYEMQFKSTCHVWDHVRKFWMPRKLWEGMWLYLVWWMLSAGRLGLIPGVDLSGFEGFSYWWLSHSWQRSGAISGGKEWGSFDGTVSVQHLSLCEYSTLPPQWSKRSGSATIFVYLLGDSGQLLGKRTTNCTSKLGQRRLLHQVRTYSWSKHGSPSTMRTLLNCGWLEYAYCMWNGA